LKHLDGRSTVIPIHSGEELSRGILMEILNDAGLSKGEFIELLDQI
jgi:predicted RNA binding protein YcfA (HicA-like mRNA interferase family)